MESLNQCSIHEWTTVQYIEECEMKRRLLDLGFVKGTPVMPLMLSPSKGMCAYLVKGCKIALREIDSRHIFVKKGEESIV